MNNIVRKTVSLASLLVFALTAFMFATASAQAQAQTGFGNSSGGNDIGRTLEDFFTAAMEHSPSLRIAEERKSIGESRRRAATGQLLPQVSATTAISDNRQETTQDGLRTYRGERYALQLQQVLFNWQAFNRRRQAQATEYQYEAEYYDELAMLFAQVAELYFNVLQAQDAVESNRSEMRAIRNQLEQVERLYGLQMVQVTDLYDVQARVASLEAEQLALTSDVVIAKEALRSATGLTAGDLYQLHDDQALPELDGTIDDWVRTARNNSHRITAREFAVQAADRRVSESRGAYMPQVNLILQQQRSNIGFDNMPMQRTDTGYVGINLTMPLYAGGSNRANVNEAQSLHSIASNELRQVQLEVADRTRMIYLRMQSNEMYMQAAERMVESMTLSATSRQRGFELGNITSVELLDALRDQFQAERNRQSLRYEHIKLGLLLRQSAGTLSAEDMLDVSSWLQPAPVTPANN